MPSCNHKPVWVSTVEDQWKPLMFTQLTDFKMLVYSVTVPVH